MNNLVILNGYNEILNRRWKNYFNWTILFPSIAFVLVFGVMVYLMSSLFSHIMNGDMENLTDTQITQYMLGGFFGSALGIFLMGTLTVIYTIWFFIASDDLFKLLGVNRLLGNVINLILVIFFCGLGFLTTPLYLWYKVKKHWELQNIPSSWRNVVK